MISMKQYFNQSIVVSCCAVTMLLACTQPTLQSDDSQRNGGMVHVPAGWFWRGLSEETMYRFVAACIQERDAGEDCAGWFRVATPRNQVWLDAFWIDRLEVSNADFRQFVQATGHVTDAERENKGAVRREQDGTWGWFMVDGANWRSPQGADSHMEAGNHPVLQVS
ncbi:Sulfatase-modifying factor enzyme 1 [Lampropedia hyalina DSM 16112]|jgi:formylglycine-generating enzyme required for sulfatase activity|uniref:Sulfatase-modifying factor enzyme 1 n=1 Tax=Lampropedia hyalina DSM 16112 TaxID=1122156 RepID=A0A1M4YRQ9_9BURK|nr:Sulfatase-modifying factor enzyme 1 [Lampropedia hyalina DSM 16112]